MISLLILPDLFTLYQLPKKHLINMQEVLEWPWYTISKTKDELSLLLPSQINPSFLQDNVAKVEENWRALQVDAQMDFGLVGILASIINPLRDNGIPIFCISTFNTDYVLVKQDSFENAIGVLTAAPGIVVKSGLSVMDE
ncbi:ACT domain-containing protein [Halteromyces radiatus]|uniref:ACT domain-containing protein n=1 Tax=Halteromyces radiatus TaxID=101107 RepID=UPI002220CFAB|nr:ACT domain-containing protein [Halteromyces radiatus]KAI8086730.1 ACT domain-containing protein [Halteromyces radiatus]